MLKFPQPYNYVPASFTVDPSDTFEPGMIAQHKLFGNTTVVGTSDGRAPFGIIDDIRVNSFSAVAYNEDHKVLVTNPTITSGRYYTSKDIYIPLNNPFIFPESFISSIPGDLNSRNGIITIMAGTELNFIDGGVPIGINIFCSYRFAVAGLPGVDTTNGSGRITIHYGPMFIQTDQYETNMQYPVGAPLYCNEKGYFTTRKIEANYPPVGMVTDPPSAIYNFLGVYWRV